MLPLYIEGNAPGVCIIVDGKRKIYLMKKYLLVLLGHIEDEPDQGIGGFWGVWDHDKSGTERR